MQTDDEDKLLRSVALQNVQSILQARQRAEQELNDTKEALEEETRILELLNKTGATLASKLELQNLVQAVTDAATQLSGAQFGAFFYAVSHADGGGFTLSALTGAPREAFERLGNPRATPIFAPTFHGQGVIRIANVLTDPRYGKMGPHHGMPQGHLPVRSYLAVPVIARSGEVMGGLFFGHEDVGVFSERSERLIVGIAAQAAIAIDNARLYEEAKRSAEERARLLDAERLARAEIERISLIKDEFLATLSHELRTPLNSVLGWSELLLSRAKGDSDTRRGLETIARNARAQAQLIDDLLDMNRIVSGKMRLDTQRVEVAAIVEAALDSMAPSAAAKEISVGRLIDRSARPIAGDPNRLQQIVWNLLTNAVKFTPKGGRIDVSVQNVSSHVEIIVSDSGMGIKTDFLPHLFERFRQADSSTTRSYGGLGLGLSIVRQLVEMHGGTVKADSPGVGAGATFTVSLPVPALMPAESPRGQVKRERPPIGEEAPQLSLTGIKVLVVDDQPDARELVKCVLCAADAEVHTAASADEALALVSVHRPDVIVSDIGMPERDGYNFIRDLRGRAAEAGGTTPAIALSAFARSEDRTCAVLAGYQVHVSKPVDPQEIVATIKGLVVPAADPVS